MRRLSLLLLVLVLGCQSSGINAPTAASKGDAVSFPVRGKIVSVAGGRVMLNHEAVPGFMDAMAMEYKLKDPAIAGELHPGDRITAKILGRKDAAGFRDLQLDEIVIIAQAKPDYVPKVQYHVPQPGDAVPDFALLNQSGRTVHLAQFKGRVVLMTFIYTRCQAADFCPRMSTNFAAIDKALAADPAVYAKTHLVSVSFDPAYDTPAVLKRYGSSYTGRFANEDFAHWDFAAPPEKELPAMTQFFDVGVMPGDGDAPATLTHSLSTVLIGKDGKVVGWYPSNEWKVEDMLAAVKAAAA